MFIPRQYINGALLSRSIGKHVSILVKVTSVDNSGRNLDAKTTDDFHIKVVMEDVLNSPIEDWVEVQGVVSSNNVISCKEIICFDEDGGKPFNPKNHNMMLSFMHNAENFEQMGP